MRPLIGLLIVVGAFGAGVAARSLYSSPVAHAPAAPLRQ